mmetsp:Transcript_14770/g.29939  ORF Transcript_14770/g.29939 Transcript_14770/m.29939 type:complete len:80 (-) Transcript_14770:247-486(-)
MQRNMMMRRRHPADSKRSLRQNYPYQNARRQEDPRMNMMDEGDFNDFGRAFSAGKSDVWIIHRDFYKTLGDDCDDDDLN